MSISNMTVDNEFRYIIQWFNEWSELQREDFISAIYEYLNGTSTNVSNIDVTQMNNLAHDMNKVLIVHDKPMSLFQCRLKLFRQWNPKWPIEYKSKLQKKIMEIDTKVGEKLGKMLEESSLDNVNYTKLSANNRNRAPLLDETANPANNDNEIDEGDELLSPIVQSLNTNTSSNTTDGVVMDKPVEEQQQQKQTEQMVTMIRC